MWYNYDVSECVYVQAAVKLNAALKAFAWGPIMLIFFVLVGVHLSIRTNFIQLKLSLVFQKTLGSLFRGNNKASTGALTPFQAMTTALAGTVGTGNIAGVTGAIFLGGAGAVFWMWVSAFFGMCTKYAEIVLAVHYRRKNRAGTYCGGPMYYIEAGLGKRYKLLAVCFAVLGCAASFGIGNMAQSSEIAGAAESLFGAEKAVTGAALAVVVALIVLGGIKRIGTVTAYLVPAMSVFYVLAGLYVLIVRAQDIPAMFARILTEAFSLKAVGGGILGCGMIKGIKLGFARGVFSNEAGLGSAPIAHAAADTDSPCEQAMWGIFEVFADTIVICSVTAFVVLLSGIADAPSGLEAYSSLGTAAGAAFNAVMHGALGGKIIELSLIFFALSSIICWCYYGESCLGYLTNGNKAAGIAYKAVFILFCYLGAVGSGAFIWDISDTLNGLMAIPNLATLFLLSGKVGKLTREYCKKYRLTGSGKG